MQVRSMSPAATAEIAALLARKLKAGDVLTLEGDLGAGKTTFTKALGKALGVTRTINSPTFTIIKEYEGNLPFYHMDAYRLEDTEEDLGFEEYFDGSGVTVVEWASYIETYLPGKRLDIEIAYEGEEERILTFTPRSSHFETICEEIYDEYSGD
ncbi:tRNA (adenosine(37)-N6)-threonylcarbamoyltransferase complex ATPase subunit type 1 TsaE [Salimicrobium halophilum]|uniref:tRNA threonylcarbamoyladenosine biosynthesis protein TsaE n=1 Tax=Salimicrobium halophilum TaxID=86666 RepID=A0A1G8WJ99_9BACI|nr:tRNA (adenosine(37)-N6)-threonylcarbamoyltransferase complex ATPase subunit type 1 TsaE [Salimicrobium halophilum]SDJ78207.1 tRNA threonylcarbamoyladenosine biosynthesis protein TsaE [Salimicrobium halophilum]